MRAASPKNVNTLHYCAVMQRARAISVLLFFSVVHSLVLAQRERRQIVASRIDCPVCNADQCPASCLYGTAVDACNCCVCAQKEGDRCDLMPTASNEPFERTFGPCGQFSVCAPRKALPEDDGLALVGVPICQCTTEGAVCGSDGQTYESICHLMTGSLIQNIQITVARMEPCDSRPQITKSLGNQKASKGDKVTLGCEVKGYPVPTVNWFRRASTMRTLLPDDDMWLSVTHRGGPNDNQVSSWLQIGYFDPDVHAGDYICVAKNKLGRIEAEATIETA